MIDTNKLSAALGPEFVLVCLTEHHWHIRDTETQTRLLNVWPNVNKYLECGAPKGHRAKLAGHDEIVRAARQVRQRKLQSIKDKAEQQAKTSSASLTGSGFAGVLRDEIFGPGTTELPPPPPAPPAIRGERSPGDNVRSGPYVISGKQWIQNNKPLVQDISVSTERYDVVPGEEPTTDVQTLINESVTRITTQGKYKHRVEFCAAYTTRSQADEVEQLLLDLGRRSDYPAEFSVKTTPAKDPKKAIAELRHWLEIAMLQLNHNGDLVSRSFALNIKAVLESTAK